MMDAREGNSHRYSKERAWYFQKKTFAADEDEQRLVRFGSGIQAVAPVQKDLVGCDLQILLVNQSFSKVSIFEKQSVQSQ